MNGIVQHHGQNPHGRDFVVGDIHGCFDLLREALDGVGFIPATDRLFSVGDLIDRGPRSTEALHWLAQPWFHGCLGNHEEMALQSPHDEGVLLNWVLFNGGRWWLEQDEESRARYIEAFQRLPVAREVETPHGGVGIVHADVPEGLDWQAFLAALESGDAGVREQALWGRRHAEARVAAPVEGIARVVCGHTITANYRVHRKANIWFIDTGAFLSGCLSLLSLEALFEVGGP